MNDVKIVDFSKCGQCAHWEKPENEDPCWECLAIPGRVDSTTPINFVKKESDQNGKENSKHKSKLR